MLAGFGRVWRAQEMAETAVSARGIGRQDRLGWASRGWIMTNAAMPLILRPYQAVLAFAIMFVIRQSAVSAGLRSVYGPARSARPLRVDLRRRRAAQPRPCRTVARPLAIGRRLAPRPRGRRAGAWAGHDGPRRRGTGQLPNGRRPPGPPLRRSLGTLTNNSAVLGLCLG